MSGNSLSSLWFFGGVVRYLLSGEEIGLKDSGMDSCGLLFVFGCRG